MLLQPVFVGSGNDSFVCLHCGADVPSNAGGGYRNHCPYCLWSRHMDEAPGDRLSACQALMAPVALLWHGRKGYQILHRCTECGAERRNRVSDCADVPDDPDELVRLSTAGG